MSQIEYKKEMLVNLEYKNLISNFASQKVRRINKWRILWYKKSHYLINI